MATLRLTDDEVSVLHQAIAARLLALRAMRPHDEPENERRRQAAIEALLDIASRLGND